jgi:hypothetical protein
MQKFGSIVYTTIAHVYKNNKSRNQWQLDKHAAVIWERQFRSDATLHTGKQKDLYYPVQIIF